MAYRCIPIDTVAAERFRATGRDDAGGALRRVIVKRVPGGGTYPCRHCLAPAEDGSEVLLGSFSLARPKGAYWTPSPVFVHADACPRFDESGDLPAFMRRIPLSIRAYDAADQMLYDLSDAIPGAEADALIERALGDARTQYANIHTARFGCYLCRVERAS
jgi:hypothetical protein